MKRKSNLIGTVVLLTMLLLSGCGESQDRTGADHTGKTTEVETTKLEDDNISIGKRNALESAKDFLTYDWSYNGLYDQLEYEGYTDEEIKYALDNCEADWKKNAVGMAKSYLGHSSFSYDGLRKQLIEYDKYTEDEAKYGVENCGADWNEEAKRMAEKWLETDINFSSQGLYKQLIFAGFTEKQAEYGVTAVGY